MVDFSAESAGTIPSTAEDFKVDAQNTDGINEGVETEWINPFFAVYFGYYNKIPELNRAINTKSILTVGTGYTADNSTMAVLDNITGWGVDTFNTILENMIIMMQINGDSFAEIIRDGGAPLLNLKPLDPSAIRIVTSQKGIIDRYEQIKKLPDRIVVERKFKPEDIFHFSLNRVADNIHGTSIISSLMWVIDALQEANAIQRKVIQQHGFPIKVWKLKGDSEEDRDKFKKVVQESNKDHVNIFIPDDTVEIEIVSIPPNATLNILTWIQYLKGLFFTLVGVSEVQAGGIQTGATESAAKVSSFSAEHSVKSGQRYVKAQVWNQLALRIELNKIASIAPELQADEKKDAGQGLNFQPNETTAGEGR